MSILFESYRGILAADLVHFDIRYFRSTPRSRKSEVERDKDRWIYWEKCHKAWSDRAALPEIYLTLSSRSRQEPINAWLSGSMRKAKTTWCPRHADGKRVLHFFESVNESAYTRIYSDRFVCFGPGTDLRDRQPQGTNRRSGRPYQFGRK